MYPRAGLRDRFLAVACTILAEEERSKLSRCSLSVGGDERKREDGYVLVVRKKEHERERNEEYEIGILKIGK